MEDKEQAQQVGDAYDRLLDQIQQSVSVDPTTFTTHRLLHVLWTKAVGTEGYNKAEWRELEARLNRLPDFHSFK